MTLYIGYARKTCDTELVRKTFSSILEDDYIETIVQKVKKYRHTFQICFKKNIPRVQELIHRIYCENFIQVAYAIDWDWKLRKYVDRYWKVYSYDPCTNFKAYIMEKPKTKLEVWVPSIPHRDPTEPVYTPITFVPEVDSEYNEVNEVDSETEWNDLKAALDQFGFESKEIEKNKEIADRESLRMEYQEQRIQTKKEKKEKKENTQVELYP